MTTLFLVRHGEAQYDLAEQRRLIGGMRDFVPLTACGRQQADQAACQLLGCNINKILSSPMTRAMETAHIISSRLQVPLAVEFDLHEWLPDLRFTYDNTAFVRAQTAEMHKSGGEWPPGVSCSWEPLSRVRERVQTALRKHAGDSPLAVTMHGMVIFALTGQSVGTGQIVEYELPSS